MLIISKRCPSGSPQDVMFFVGQNVLRLLGDTLSASIKTPCGKQNLNGKDQQTQYLRYYLSH
jgi:hypothetical protein